MNTIDIAFYHQTGKDTWAGRNDGAGLSVQRWHQRVILVDMVTGQLPLIAGSQKGIALIGFASDEGVRRNGGRTGAKSGPLYFRKACAN